MHSPRENKEGSNSKSKKFHSFNFNIHNHALKVFKNLQEEWVPESYS